MLSWSNHLALLSYDGSYYQQLQRKMQIMDEPVIIYIW